MRPSVALPTGTEIGPPGVRNVLITHQTFRRVHRDAAHGVLAEVLRDLEHQPIAVVVGLQRVQNRRQVVLELHVHDGADNLSDLAYLAHVGLLLERLGARNNLDQFVGDRGLARTVELDRQLLDHLARIAGRVVHGGHARALFRGGILQQPAEHLGRQVARQQIGEDFLLVRLVFVVCRRRTIVLELGRDDLECGRKPGSAPTGRC